MDSKRSAVSLAGNIRRTADKVDGNYSSYPPSGTVSNVIHRVHEVGSFVTSATVGCLLTST